ncbi:hypothetical protein [Thiohalophilus sp.]|uniref:hypothetical protein n=1 Tax=Thiohalophilus sp. TaxID=3028392 RepID=UPI002ACD9F55|nr:hypothetical protein [Thiohalophilus sp.]MDZ7662430.1 hypothetical protein [Thiohalophilus sp.]
MSNIEMIFRVFAIFAGVMYLLAIIFVGFVNLPGIFIILAMFWYGSGFYLKEDIRNIVIINRIIGSVGGISVLVSVIEADIKIITIVTVASYAFNIIILIACARLIFFKPNIN